jgi:hypothetical protein
MRLLKSLRDFCRNLQKLSDWQRSFLQAVGQSLALQILHDQKIRVALSADVVERADIDMLQRGDRLGFPLQALFQLGIRGKMRRQNLDGDRTVKTRIHGSVHLTHAAGAPSGDWIS